MGIYEVLTENFACFPQGIQWGIKPGQLFYRIDEELYSEQ